MGKDQFKKMIQKGEVVREQKDYSTALAIFDQAMLISGQQNKWADFAEALGHRIVIDKHFWWETRDKGFLELMRSDTELGLKISISKKLSPRYLAVFQLRMGDILIDFKQYKKALSYYRQSVKSLTKTPRNAGYGEYLVHLGKGLIYNKKNQQAEKNLTRALKLMKKDKEVRPFHRLILESGAISYLAVAVNDTDHQRAKNLFDQAALMGKELKNKYHMTMRSKQLKLMKKEFKF